MKKKDKVAEKEAPREATSTLQPKFFQKYALPLAMSLGLILLAYLAMNEYSKLRDRRCKKAYKQARTETEKKAFAADFIGQPLAAKVSLELADEFYAAGNYKDALRFYELAVPALVSTPLGPRAALGKAMSFVQLQQLEQAQKVFQRLMSDPKAAGALQADATLQAMLIAFENKDEAAISRYRQELETLPYSELALERMRLIEGLVGTD